MIASAARRIAVTCTVIGLAAIGVAAAPKPAHAWWHGYGWGVGIYVPPIVVTPPPAYYAPPAYYPAARLLRSAHLRLDPRHWQGNYWVPGHWS